MFQTSNQSIYISPDITRYQCSNPAIHTIHNDLPEMISKLREYITRLIVAYILLLLCYDLLKGPVKSEKLLLMTHSGLENGKTKTMFNSRAS